VEPTPRIAKLALAYDTTEFTSGSSDLDRNIKVHALQSQRANIAQTYVAVVQERVVGYHTLVVGSVTYEESPERLNKAVPRHPVPIMLLARLAVDTTWQAKGLGLALVVDAMRRVLQVADIAGVRAMAVHAKDDNARRFYEHLGFEAFPGQALTLYRLVKDIRSMQSDNP
jgi:predicted N-acetyltransferase YhbS